MFSAEHMFFSKRIHVQKTLLCRKQINSTLPKIVENSWKIVEKSQKLARLRGKSCDFYLGILTLEENHRNPRNDVNIETYGTTII